MHRWPLGSWPIVHRLLISYRDRDRGRGPSEAAWKQCLSTPGFEPGLSQPQRDVLTTRRCGPHDHCILRLSTDQLTLGSCPAQGHELQVTRTARWRQSAPSSAKRCHSSTGTRAQPPRVGRAPLGSWQLANRASLADQLQGPWQRHRAERSCMEAVPVHTRI